MGLPFQNQKVLPRICRRTYLESRASRPPKSEQLLDSCRDGGPSTGLCGRRSCSFLLYGYGVTETFQAMDEVSGQVMLVEVVQVGISEFVVVDSLGIHVIDGHQDLVGHRYRCRLYPRRALRR